MRDLVREGRRPSPNGAASIVDAAMEDVEVPVTEQRAAHIEGAATPEVTAGERDRGVGPVASDAPRIAVDAEALSQRVAAILEPRVTSLVVARRDQWLAWLAGQFIEVAKILDPITRIVAARILSLAALAAAIAVSVYTIALIQRDIERVGALVAILAFLGLVVRRGQPKAPPEPPR